MPTELPRREFNRRFFPAIAGVTTYGLPLGSLDRKEILQTPEIVFYRTGHRLGIYGVDQYQEGHPLRALHENNLHIRDASYPTPSITEGFATAHGDTSQAEVQILNQYNELSDLGQLSRQQRNVLTIADIINSDQVLPGINRDSPEFNERYIEILWQLGLAGVIATKEGNYGRIFLASIMHPRLEREINTGFYHGEEKPLILVTMDSVGIGTPIGERQLSQYYSERLTAINPDGTESTALFPWVGEPSTALLRIAGIHDDNIGFWLRLQEIPLDLSTGKLIIEDPADEFLRKAEPKYPEYYITTDIDPSHKLTADIIRAALRMDKFRYDAYPFNQELTATNFIPVTLVDNLLRQGIDLQPVYIDNHSDFINRSVDHPIIPTDHELSLQYFLRELGRAGHLDTVNITYDRVSGPLPDNSIFELQYAPGYDENSRQVFVSGFCRRSDKGHNCTYMSDRGLVHKSHAELVFEMGNSEEGRLSRIVHYF